MSLWTLTFRQLRGRPGRAVLTVLSIVLAVAAMVAVRGGTAASRRAAEEMFESLTGRVALEVVARSGDTFDAAIVEKLAEAPGVAAAAPVLDYPTVLYHGQRRRHVLVAGIDAKKDHAVRDYELRKGRMLVGAENGALVDETFARTLGLDVGGSISLLTRRGRTDVPIVGLLAPQGIAAMEGGGLVRMPLVTVQYLFRQPGQVTAVSLASAQGAALAEVSQAVAALLPPELIVREPTARTRVGRETLMGIEQGLRFAAVVVLVLSGILILNTFLMNLGERRRELAILRALGATGRQVQRLLLGEALALGAAGAVLGVPLGLAGGRVLLRLMELVYNTPLPGAEISWGAIALAAALGPAVAAAAVSIPSLIARRISPLEGMRPVIAQRSGRFPWRLIGGGIGVYAAAGLAFDAALRGWLPIEAAVPIGSVFLVTSIFVVAVLLEPLTRGAAALLALVFPAESYLARHQVLRRRGRTLLTVGLLYLAISVAISLGATLVNSVRDVRTWYNQTMAGDFLVSSALTDPATGVAQPMDDALADEIRAIPGVTQVTTGRFLSGTVDGQAVIVIVSQFDKQQRLPLDIREGDPEEVRRGLVRGEAVIGSSLAYRLEKTLGDEVTLDTPRGPKTLRIAGMTVSYSVGGLILCIDRRTAEELLDTKGSDAFVVDALPDARDEVRRRLGELADRQSLTIESFAALRRRAESILDGVVGSLWALVALGLAVSAMGITNTLTINVLEQTRELAALRVVGMTRGQVRKTIFCQAVILGVVSAVVGLITGVFTACVINATQVPLMGHAIPLHLDPLLIGSCLALGFLLVLASAWLPSERAARLDLLTALHYE